MVGARGPTQRVCSVCELLQLGAKESTAVDAGAPLSGAACVFGSTGLCCDPMTGLVERAGGPVALVQAGLSDRRQRWDSPFLV